MPAPATVLWLIAVASAGLGLLGLQVPIHNEEHEDDFFDVPWWKDIAERYGLHERTHASPSFPAQDCLTVSLTGEGFHLKAAYSLQCPLGLMTAPTDPAHGLAEVTILQPLPAELFIDPYELQGLRTDDVVPTVFGSVDLEQPAPACTPTVVGLTLLALTNGRRDGRHGRPATTHPAVAVMPVHAKYPTPLHPVCEGGSKAQETTSGAHANPGAGGCCCNTQAKRNGTGLLPSIWKQLLYGPVQYTAWPAPLLLVRWHAGTPVSSEGHPHDGSGADGHGAMGCHRNPSECRTEACREDASVPAQACDSNGLGAMGLGRTHCTGGLCGPGTDHGCDATVEGNARTRLVEESDRAPMKAGPPAKVNIEGSAAAWSVMRVLPQAGLGVTVPTGCTLHTEGITSLTATVALLCSSVLLLCTVL